MCWRIARGRTIFMRLKGFGAAIFVLGVMFLFYDISAHTVRTYIKYLLSDIDQNIEGVITKSRLGTIPRGTKFYDIEYEYQVDGVYYKSSMVAFSERTKNPRDVVEKYPEGKRVMVFYDSSRPNIAILEQRGLGYEIIWHFLISGCFSFLVLA